MKTILAADIGGTNSRFAHFTVDKDDKLSLVSTLWLDTKKSPSFGNLIDHLKKDFTLSPEQTDICVIAVAGPVERGVFSSPPFIKWDIEISNAKKDFGFNRCLLINDFVAQAFACRSPVADSAEKILPGEAVMDAAVAVIGAGTALGKAALSPDGSGGFIAIPSEGGPSNFPFVTNREFEFQEYLLNELGEEYITANIVVSGRGLSYIHHFLTGEKLDPSEVTVLFSQDSETLQWASRFYARVCRNYALDTLALGGVYIAGGVAVRSPDLLRHGSFEKEFRSSFTMSAILNKIPVFLITNEESGLWGAGFLGLQSLKKQ